MIDIDSLKDWVAPGNRQVNIQLGGPEPLGPDHEKIEVYDYNLRAGQTIADVCQINLLLRKKMQIEALERKVARLKSEVEEIEYLSETD